MGNGMNRVLPGLYVGNYRDSKDASQLDRHKITHIIAIHDAARRIHTCTYGIANIFGHYFQSFVALSRMHLQDKEYLCIMASDSPYQNLSQYFPTCNDFIHSARIQGGNVLIHCLAGMSRSVTIAVAYIMSITSLRWNEALKVVRGARAVSNPNSGFQKQLQDFESTKLPEERRRLQEKFPGTTYFENDEEQCKKLLAAYNNMVLSRAICEGRCATQKVCPTGTCRPHTASPRLGRQKSTDSSISQPGTSSSPFSRAGSTKSLDSATEAPGSPRNWERHYGCWRSHFRHRQGTSSTPSTPILYRACKRTDSITSISSMSSVASLNTAINDDGKDPVSAGVGSSAPSGPMSSSVILERNPFLATQSCPNSPRRTPKKLPQTRAAGGGFVTTRTSEMFNLVRKNAAAKAAISSAPTEKVATVASKVVTATSTTKTTTTVKTFAKCVTGGASSSGVVVTAIRTRPSSASAVLSSSSTPKPITFASTQNPSKLSISSPSQPSSIPKPVSSLSQPSTSPKPPPASISSPQFPTPSSTATTSAAGPSSNTSSPCSSPWATPPSSPAHRSPAQLRKTTASGSGSKNVTVTASGATRWVMKRSAYKYSLDNS